MIHHHNFPLTFGIFNLPRALKNRGKSSILSILSIFYLILSYQLHACPFQGLVFKIFSLGLHTRHLHGTSIIQLHGHFNFNFSLGSLFLGICGKLVQLFYNLIVHMITVNILLPRDEAKQKWCSPGNRLVPTPANTRTGRHTSPLHQKLRRIFHDHSLLVVMQMLHFYGNFVTKKL